MNTEPTTITITDPVLLKLLAETTGPIMFRDPAGVPIRYADGLIGVPRPGLVPPIAMDELERRRQATTGGRPLTDILRDLQEKHGA